jgi:preprotein translocase subunit Sss1
MDTSEVYMLFEEIKENLKTGNNQPSEQILMDVQAVNSMTEQFRHIIEEVRKPTRTEHRHVIEIGSSKVFLSLIGLALTVILLGFIIYNQWQNLSLYKDNDLKYRYVKMQGQITGESIYCLEDMFEHADSIRLIRNQVEKYEYLVKEQAEKMEWARRSAEEAERLRKELESIKK